MTTRTTAGKAASRDLAAEIVFLTRALKAPTLRDAVDRLAERARAESWSHEEFLVACLQREVSARESHGGEGRIRAARFPARKSLEEFDFDHARRLKRDTIAHLGTLAAAVAPGGTLLIVGHHPADMPEHLAERGWTADQLAASLTHGWAIDTSAVRPRPFTDSNGQRSSVRDTVLRAHRLPNSSH